MKKRFRHTTPSRIHVMPTRYGAFFLLVLSAMLTGSINYNNNLGFLLTFLLGGMVIVSIFHTRGAVRGLSIADTRARPVFAGENALFEVRVRKQGGNAGTVRLSIQGSKGSLEKIPPGHTSVFRVPIPATRRGTLEPGPITASSRYPMDLFRAWTVLPEPAPCLVYPKPVFGPDLYAPGRNGTGGESGASGTGTEDFSGLRPYEPGDSLMQVSWKAYSKGQGLLTKQFTGETGSVRFADWLRIGEPDVELKLSRLCGLVLRSHRQQVPFGLRLPGRVIEADTGESHLHECLRALARFGGPGPGSIDTPETGDRP